MNNFELSPAELKQMPWGMNEMQVDDPYGNAIKFGEPISL